MAFDKNHTSLGMKIIIVIFAVVLVVSLCLPFFSSCSSSAGTSGSGEDSSSSDASSAQTASATTVAGVRAQYQTLIDSLSSRLASDPASLTYMASLGNAYYDCASEMQSASDAAAEADAVAEEFGQAVTYYDLYLAAVRSGAEAQQSSVSAVTVDRCVCLFYSGSEDEAMADLAAFLEETPDYAMGWYNLGVMRETTGDYEGAAEAYAICAEVDADGSVGAYANLRRALLESSLESEDASEDADASEEEDGGAADEADAEDGDDGETAASSAADGAEAEDASAEAEDASAEADAS